MLYDRVVDNKEIGLRICITFNNDLYRVKWFSLRWMICTMMNEMYHVEWFVIQGIICTKLNDMCYVELLVLRWVICTTLKILNYVEWFVKRWIICSTALNYLYYVDWYNTLLQNFYDREWFVHCWNIYTTLNDSECDGLFVQRWIIWTILQ